MITEGQYRKFEEIRKLGEYNMITEYELIMIELDLTKEEYMELLANYDDVRDEYDY
jgi:hypothetical protein